MNRAWVPAAILLATEAQLAVAELVPGIERFEGKAFGARLVAYPLLMLAVPAAWWLVRRGTPAPWGAFALVMLPFLVDVTGNSLDLYDTLVWWDDANHFVNWIPLCLGLGLLVTEGIDRAWQKVVLVVGVGALLAVAWELGEWFTFIRQGTELDTAYEDTLGDEALGTLGALVAGLLTVRFGSERSGHRPDMSTPSADQPIENANEADVAEQTQDADGPAEDAVVDEDAYPHQAEEDAVDR